MVRVATSVRSIGGIRRGRGLIGKGNEMIKTTSSLACLVSALLFAPVTQAAVLVEQPYAIEWSAQIGTSAVDQSVSVAVDSSGNTYISGVTGGDLDGTNAGSADAFLTKFDASGNVLWTRQIGTAKFDGCRAVAVDSAGYIYISGGTSGSLGGTYAGAGDTYLTKFDPSGNVLWSRQIGTTKSDESFGVAVDGSSNVYITGTTSGSLGGANEGEDDIYLTKFDSSGNVVWTQQIGTEDDDFAQSVTVDSSGNIYISGGTYGSLDGTNAGSVDAFLTKFDTSGNELWTEQLGTAYTDGSNAVATDSAGNVYISGITAGDLGGTNAGANDAFLTKYDASGNLQWSRQIGTISDDRSYSVAVDSSGNIFISGFTRGDLNGGTNAGNYDAFVAKYDASGSLLWTQLFGTTDVDESHALAVDSEGNVYSSGYTYGDLGGTNAGDFDAFLVKFTVPEPTSLSLLALGALALLRRRG